MSSDKEVRLDPTNAVILSKDDGKIICNGIRQRCPHCGKVMLYNDAVIIWKVGAVEKWECCKCRKQYNTITIPVPVDTTPEEFYETISKAFTDFMRKSARL